MNAIINWTVNELNAASQGDLIIVGVVVALALALVICLILYYIVFMHKKKADIYDYVDSIKKMEKKLK
jgi:tellurite resistance protein TehA-like permease